jgi:uncharacterized membrane protein YoaT (DUF817 family)
MTLLSWHTTILDILRRRSSDSAPTSFIRELFCFGYKESLSCVFPVFIFGMLALTKLVSIPFIPRYDVLLIACLAMQYLMYRVGLESKKEVAVICLFHLLGVCMEIFKVSHGAWAYPEPAYSKVLGVPLYSGFMYASVASYICQAWRHFNIKLEDWPSVPQSSSFAVAIYGNFYTNAYVMDGRLLIIPLLIFGFWKTWVQFETNGIVRRMPMVASFFLIAFFIWVAENVATFLGAWRYPYQVGEWSVVRLQLISSWFLLVIVSIIIVAVLKRKEEHRPPSGDQ